MSQEVDFLSSSFFVIKWQKLTPTKPFVGNQELISLMLITFINVFLYTSCLTWWRMCRTFFLILDKIGSFGKLANFGWKSAFNIENTSPSKYSYGKNSLQKSEILTPKESKNSMGPSFVLDERKVCNVSWISNGVQHNHLCFWVLNLCFHVLCYIGVFSGHIARGTSFLDWANWLVMALDMWCSNF